MIFDVVTLFPEMFDSVMSASLLGKARDKGLFELVLSDPRRYTTDKHHSVDDTPYGGGAGMVMRPEPLMLAIEACEAARGAGRRLLLSPAGRPLDQAAVLRLAALPHLILVCGRYEGIDERVAQRCDEELSLGDYVLTGGELGAMVLIDAIARRLPAVLGNEASPLDESFEAGLLEYPHYTRPAEWRGAPVPPVLLSGNHEQIRRWRRQEALLRTRLRRPDLFARLPLDDEAQRLLAEADAAKRAP